MHRDETKVWELIECVAHGISAAFTQDGAKAFSTAVFGNFGRLA